MMLASGPVGRGQEPLPGDKDAGGARKDSASPARPKPDMRLGRNQRITRSALFRETYGQGTRWIGKYMVLWRREGEDASLRLGVVTSRKVGKAVQRVKARRLLREIYRQNRWQFHGAYDVILVARRALLDAPWEDLVAELLALAGRAGLLPENDKDA
ncbi:MAG: ribonuclease P protein component [Verrucomicrobia bacterium]|nr:ribonuclease P protein component [Verrucomicrobiota bacterium]